MHAGEKCSGVRGIEVPSHGPSWVDLETLGYGREIRQKRPHIVWFHILCAMSRTGRTMEVGSSLSGQGRRVGALGPTVVSGMLSGATEMLWN